MKKIMPKNKLRLLLWRWHRRIGLFSAFFVLLLSVTGILLNHSNDLRLDHIPLRSRLLLSLYGIEKPKIISYHLNGEWLSHLGGDYLYRNTQELAYCSGDLSGAVYHKGIWVVACSNELLLFTQEGEVVERIGVAYGIPQPIDQLGQCGDQLCLKNNSKIYQINMDQLTWKPYEEILSGDTVVWAQITHTPKSLHRSLVNNYLGQAITWERFLLDLHSGRLWGKGGVYFTDLVSVFFLVLAGTGFYLWLLRSRRREQV